jgi:membrane protein required for colicin V production
MTGFDIAVIGVVALSVLLAFFRGVVRELMALVTWIAALVVALAFQGPVTAVLPAFVSSTVVRHVVAFVLIFIAVLVIGSIVSHLLAKLIRAVGLGFVDRFLGGIFGLARGVIIAVVGVLIAGVTQLPRSEWWQNAALAPPLVEAALALRPWLPAPWADRLDYSADGKRPVRPRGEAARAQNGELQGCVES